MNEELKIIIKAVTQTAQEEIDRLRQEIERLSKGAKESGGKIGASFKGIAKGAAAAVAAVAAIGAAIVALGKNTLQFQKEQARLVSSFEAAGASAKQATETYKGLYRFLGDTGKASEAAAHLAKITTNQKDLAQWTKIAQGVYATFGDSLPIEGLTEAANETIRVGKVTGTMADALNWAGVSEDEFNSKLATTNSLSEREAMVRSTLNELYQDAAEAYERNNKALLDYNESQANLDTAMADAGKAVLPLLTALNNLGSAFFTALKPALDAIIPPLAAFINMIAKAIQGIMSFFSALTGKSSSIKAMGNEVKSAAKGAGALSSGLSGAGSAAEGAAKSIEEAKKSTQGFDELNIVSSGQGSSSGGSGGGGASAPAYATGGIVDSAVFETEVEETSGVAKGLADKIKEIFAELKVVFAPSIEAWSGAFQTVKESWNNAKPDFINGAIEIKDAFLTFGNYLDNEFVPNVVNSFSTNLAPVLGDLAAFSLEETGKTFAWFGEQVKISVDDVVIPATQRLETMSTDTFAIIGEAWKEHGSGFLEQLSIFGENVRGALERFYNEFFKPIWDKVLAVWDNVWTNGLKPLIDKFVNACLEIGQELLILYNEVIKPIVDWIMTYIYPIIVGVINKIIEIVGKIVNYIAKAIGGIIDVIKGIIKFIVGVFTGDWQKAWDGIKSIFGGVWDAIVGVAGAAWESIRLIFAPVGEFFKGCWESIKKIFGSVGEWFKDIFSKAWQAIKGVFSNWDSFFSGLWDKIKTTFSALGTKISDAISGAIKTGINGVISGIENTINKAIRLINKAIGFINDLPIGITISTIKELKFPRLAKGGIVDSATFAMIGEQGKEAVVPLENNTEWMDKLADRLTNKAPTKIILMLDGKELGTATVNAINSITKETGSIPLVFA
jgi:phage-related protein